MRMPDFAIHKHSLMRHQLSSLFVSTFKLLLNIFRQVLSDVLRRDFISYSGIAVPIGAVQSAARALTVFFPTANPLQPVSLVIKSLLRDSLLSRCWLFCGVSFLSSSY